jgi:hypothetical protein
MTKRVAYIIVCWNNKDILAECIESINQQNYKDKDIYLIDNNSSDGSADFIATNYPEIKLIRSNKNNGFARGNNLLIQEALKDEKVKYFALINSDARITSDWTEKLINESDKHKNVACLQGLTLDYFDHAIVDSHHIYLSVNLQSTQYGYQQSNSQQYLSSCEVMGVNAAATIITREFIEEQPYNKLFDESFFMYLEDVDVSLRALNIGWHNYFVAEAIAYHIGSASSKARSSSFSLYYTARNQVGLLLKNIPVSILIRACPSFLRNEYNLFIYIKSNYSKLTVFKYVQGRVVGLLRTPLYLFKRRQLQKNTKIEPNFFWTLMSSKGWVE